MEPPQHIGTSELAELLEKSRQPDGALLDAAVVHPHLAECSTCRDQYLELASLERQLNRVQLSNVQPEQPASPRPDCPSPSVWRDIAAGLSPPETTLATVGHASGCDHCGPLLRKAVAELAGLKGEITDEERRQIAALESVRPEWQQQLARRIGDSASSARGRKSASWLRPWFAGTRMAVSAAALLSLLAAGSWFLFQRTQPEAAANKLLTRAYTEKRTLELRLSGAAYAPLRVSRGSEASFTSRPAALLQAEALIAAQIQIHPSDPAWLHAQARADLLEGKYNAAVEALHRALELQPHSPVLLIDLATAQFQRAQQEERQDDLGAAYESLSQALALQPDNPVALFNRAVVAEHNFLLNQSMDDWDRYLRVDSGSDWAGEARSAAERLRKKLKEHNAKQGASLLSPQQIALSHDDPTVLATVDSRIEEYLSEAVRAWLPGAYPEHGAPDLAAQNALFFLAQLTSQRHHDHWLSDLLRGSSSSNFPQAVSALSQAAQANEAGDFPTAHSRAADAARLFLSSSNHAGALYSQFEQAFAAQLQRHTALCIQKSAKALPESKKYSYTWLQIQFELEHGVCVGQMGDLGTDEKSANHAMDRAQQNGYGALYLRGVSFSAGDRIESGDIHASGALVASGLNTYWSGEFPAMRAYNLYFELVQIAIATSRPHLRVAAWREGIAVIDTNPDLLLRAYAHRQLAEAAVETSELALAQQQYAEAARLFALAPQNDTSRSDVLEIEILAAQLESDQGQFDNAIAHLTRVQPEITQTSSNNYVVQLFYSTLGKLLLARQRPAEAEQSLRPALVLAERNLASIHSEEEQATWRKSAAPLYLGLAEAELVQGRVQESLETFESYMGASQRAGVSQHPLRPSTESPTAAHLPLLSRETVIAYAATPNGLAIWVFDNRGVNARWIPTPTANLQELATRFFNLTSDPKSSLTALQRDARALYASLISPVDPWLVPQRALVIEADGWLSRVPFEALIDSTNHYLIERASITRSLGQGVDSRMRGPNVGAGDGNISVDSPALIVASIAAPESQELTPLPDVTREAEAVAARFKSSQILQGSEATVDNVKSALPSAWVFHFAGHSLATPGSEVLLLENERPSTGAPALLDAATLRRIDVQNMRLAVLSACTTDSGADSSGGFNSISETLLRAGVPHVVASRWAIDSVEARAFMDIFYRSILAGQPVSEAVRSASKTMLQNPLTLHPYYWSAFAAYGQP